jgi:hypothetical protein
MAEVDPLTGSPLSRENRNSFFRSSRVSSSSFRGTDIGYKTEVAEQSKKFAEAQQQNQTVLTGIQQQFQNLQNQINVLSQSIANIYKLIQADTQSEQKLLVKEQQQEVQSTQRKIRIGSENQLEQKIQAALVAPVAALTNRVENIFGRVGSALSTLFLGWLGLQGIKTLTAWRNKDEDALNDIKNDLLKNIGIGVGAIASIHFGLRLVKSAITGVIRGVTSLIFNTIKLPFKAAGAAAAGLGSMLSGAKPSAAPSAAPAAGAAPSAGATKPPASGGGFWGNIKNMGGNILKGLGRGAASTGLTTGIDIALGEDPARATAGGLGATAFAAGAAKLPLPPFLKFPAVIGAGIYGQQQGKGLFDNFNPSAAEKSDDKGPLSGFNLFNQSSSSTPQQKPATPPTPTTTSSSSSKPTASPAPVSSSPSLGSQPPLTTPQQSQKLEPQKSMMPMATDLTLNVNEPKSKEEQYWDAEGNYLNEISKGLQSGMTYEELDLTQNEIDYLEGKSNASPFLIDQEKIKGVTPQITAKPEMIQPKPSTTPVMEPPKEPAPNVIVSSAPQQKKMEVPAPATVTDVPFISSSNPDNFYVLYSQLNYNVVM